MAVARDGGREALQGPDEAKDKLLLLIKLLLDIVNIDESTERALALGPGNIMMIQTESRLVKDHKIVNVRLLRFTSRLHFLSNSSYFKPICLIIYKFGEID